MLDSVYLAVLPFPDVSAVFLHPSVVLALAVSP